MKFFSKMVRDTIRMIFCSILTWLRQLRLDMIFGILLVSETFSVQAFFYEKKKSFVKT